MGEYNVGDTLIHKVSGNIMVVLFWSRDEPFEVKCRYYNSVTGHYEERFFDTREFVQKREIKIENK